MYRNWDKIIGCLAGIKSACRALKKSMRGLVVLFAFSSLFSLGIAQEPSSSEDTEGCLMCHASTHPGIVADWLNSRHAKVTPAEALQKEKLARRVSADSVPEYLAMTAVGCAECHTLNPEKHRDTFAHGGYQVHTVVTPEDCATCHPVEKGQYEQNIMSHAHVILIDNPVYGSLIASVNGIQDFDGTRTSLADPEEATNFESCLYCHGTEVGVQGTATRETVLGEMEFPILSGWPNQGVGRINPDGSMGSCAACHARHQFSIQTARKPYTCSECHKGPDVPAYRVYEVSKHGNIFSSMNKDWDFENVPWRWWERTSPRQPVLPVT